MSNLSQSWHQKLWKNIMERIQETKSLAYKDFEIPSSVVQKTICTRTGLLATGSCQSILQKIMLQPRVVPVIMLHRNLPMMILLLKILIILMIRITLQMVMILPERTVITVELFPLRLNRMFSPHRNS